MGASLLLVVIGVFTIGEPIDKSDTPQTITKKYVENTQVEIIQETTKQVVIPVYQEALESGCKDPNSRSCTNATFAMVVVNLAITIIFVVLGIVAIIVIAKAVISVLESIRF